MNLSTSQPPFSRGKGMVRAALWGTGHTADKVVSREFCKKHRTSHSASLGEFSGWW